MDSRRCAHEHPVAGVLEVDLASIISLPRRTACRAASLTRLASSAPLMPGVPRATRLEVDVGADALVAACTRKMARRSSCSGRGTTTWRSKRPGAQQRRVEDVGAVGGGDHHDALGGLEAVHLVEHLVERLLALVVAAAEPGAALAADGVDLVDEDDGPAQLAGRLEQVAHAAGADAHEHLHEVRAADRQERHAGLAGHRAGDEGLAGAGGPDEQHALGDAGADLAEALGVRRKSTTSRISCFTPS
jgi:hypothetical protein